MWNDLSSVTTFWEDVRSTMGTGEARTVAVREAEDTAATLSDGLDPDEDWTDIP